MCRWVAPLKHHFAGPAECQGQPAEFLPVAPAEGSLEVGCTRVLRQGCQSSIPKKRHCGFWGYGDWASEMDVNHGERLRFQSQHGERDHRGCKKSFKVHILSTQEGMQKGMHSLLPLVLARWLLVPWLVLLLPLIAFWPHFTLDERWRKYQSFVKARHLLQDGKWREREDSIDDFEICWKDFETCWILDILDRSWSWTFARWALLWAPWPYSVELLSHWSGRLWRLHGAGGQILCGTETNWTDPCCSDPCTVPLC